ncbi:hypothetical protein CMV_012997 [Castanea mollissima]|uniref:Uncharacterized protein n=1 Tax=Castanea mollissima TaxID=60419 RepID=A0A8J4R8N8_9ROSI|nr:hypothetical protein CMV_012997 [Castanea mollissima]
MDTMLGPRHLTKDMQDLLLIIRDDIRFKKGDGNESGEGQNDIDAGVEDDHLNSSCCKGFENNKVISKLAFQDSERCHHHPSDPSHQKRSPNDINQLKRSKLKMVKLTLIARVTDGLPLAEGLDDGHDLKDAEFYKQQLKALFKNLSRGQNEASRMSIETGPYVNEVSEMSRVILSESRIYADKARELNRQMCL